jgi:alanine dehydrogenase
MPTILLTHRDVMNLMNMKEVITAVEAAFKDWTNGRGEMPPKSYLLLKKGDFRAMPAYLPGAAGVKWVNVHPENIGKGLPTVMAVIIYNDPSTGYPLAVMDATDITAYRTGATSAIAARYLARKESQTLGIIGAGQQAYTQILAHIEVFRFKQIRVYDIFSTAIDNLMKAFPGYPLQKSSLEEAVKSDIVCTLTTARAPLIKREWILPGTHINAVGADAQGKQELEPSILNDSIVVVDDIRQASHAGEMNVPVSQGVYKVEQVYATLGEIITGKKKGRVDEKVVTVFDSTGVAIEDISTAKLLYEKAIQRGIGQSVNLIN